MGLKNWLQDRYTKKTIAKLTKEVEKIEVLEPRFKAMSDDELRSFSGDLRARSLEVNDLEEILPEAFALVREASVRVLGKRHYPVQLIGGIVLHRGGIAEMKTGEGKTLVATLPAYLNALPGHGVHVVTVNDYLARRDRDWMGKIFEFLGLTVGCITNDVKGPERRAQYLMDITYGTNNEFGFDYLRDNMSVRPEGLVQRELNYAIIDEVDSILVDEARTPLIISGMGNKPTDLYHRAHNFAISLNKQTDLIIEEKDRRVTLTEESGDGKAEEFFGIDNLADPENMEIAHHIKQALYAVYMMKRDADYVVKDGKVFIVDEFTGRIMHGRRYSNGLHQAIEAKEGLEVRKESQTLATITLQNYFRQYKKLSGMTGTAKTEEEEFIQIYNMPVTVIPTNKPIVRDDKPDVVLGSLAAKYNRIVDEIGERHSTGQPLLIGTITIEVSELLSAMLKKRGIPHEVLNAKHHDREAEIVAQAGRFGSVTIATNMAGRGTDIVLGGNAEFMALKEMRKNGYDEKTLSMVTSPFEVQEIRDAQIEYKRIYSEFSKQTGEEAEKVKAVGGLAIMGTERHESRRIDNQLRGRSGRQGDPGSTQFFLSLEDDLMRLFMSENSMEMIKKMGLKDDMEIEVGMVSRALENAQKRVEARNFDIRKSVLKYDDVMNTQRTIIYGERQKVLHGDNIKEQIEGMCETFVDSVLASFTAGSDISEDWDVSAMEHELNSIFFKGALKLDVDEDTELKDIRFTILDKVRAEYERIEEGIGSEKMREVERYALLKTVDDKWMDHIDAMDQLKQGIGLRAIGQMDPIIAYQKEGFDMFDDMIDVIKQDTLNLVFHAEPEMDTEVKESATITSATHGRAKQKTVKRETPKIGRNSPCPCGSGKKYKNCCLKKEKD